MINIYIADKYNMIKVAGDKCDKIYTDTERILPILEDSEVMLAEGKETIKANSLVMFYTSIGEDGNYEDKHVVIEGPAAVAYCDSVRRRIEYTNAKKEKVMSCGGECCDCCDCESIR